MHFREAKLPIHLKMERVTGESPSELPSESKMLDSARALIKLQEEYCARATQNIARAQERRKQQYDRKHNTNETLKIPRQGPERKLKEQALQVLSDPHICSAFDISISRSFWLPNFPENYENLKRACNSIIRIHHTGTFHWVVSTSIGHLRSCRVRVLNCMSGDLSMSMQCQLARSMVAQETLTLLGWRSCPFSSNAEQLTVDFSQSLFPLTWHLNKTLSRSHMNRLN